MAPKTEFPNFDDLIRRYQGGVSLKQLAEECGLSRTPLARALRGRRVPIRGRSEAERLKWTTLKRDRSLIERQCAAAWVACRGRKQSAAELLLRAKRRYERLTAMTATERTLHDLLEAAGLSVIPQLNVGPYNLDLAIREPRIAVEIQMAYLKGGKSVKPERLHYLLDRGWCVLIIAPGRRRPINWTRIIQHIVALAQFSGRDPSLAGQYRVINRHGKAVAFRRPYLHGRPVIPRNKPTLEPA